jgi:hypothetical protein
MTETSCCPREQLVTRREVLQRGASGLGFLAFAAMATEAAARDTELNNPLSVKPPHFKAHAKRVIMLWQRGGPPHMDTFDPKPMLRQYHGKATKELASILGDRFKRSNRKLVGSPWEFKKRGESGIEISDAFAQLAEHADDLCLVRSMHGDFPGHGEATRQMHTGQGVFIRPSMGAWTVYGLGTENQEMPGFVALDVSRSGTTENAFLPAVYGGTPVSVNARSKSGSIRHLTNQTVSRGMQRAQIDLIQKMNESLIERTEADAKIDGIIANYEIAFRMQGIAPEILNFADESEATLELYGVDDKDFGTASIGAKCLLARRMAEAGVRFIEVAMAGSDPHQKLKDGYGKAARQNDRAAAALVADLKQRGMLGETLVLCGGEFGRTPDTGRKELDGRDHNNKGFTMWLAGGGAKGGLAYGATDEVGLAAVEKPVHVHDLHATVLHLLGLDHKRLTYRHSGRDFRLTDVYGNVVEEILA